MPKTTTTYRTRGALTFSFSLIPFLLFLSLSFSLRHTDELFALYGVCRSPRFFHALFVKIDLHETAKVPFKNVKNAPLPLTVISIIIGRNRLCVRYNFLHYRRSNTALYMPYKTEEFRNFLFFFFNGRWRDANIFKWQNNSITGSNIKIDNSFFRRHF